MFPAGLGLLPDPPIPVSKLLPLLEQPNEKMHARAAESETESGESMRRLGRTVCICESLIEEVNATPM